MGEHVCTWVWKIAPFGGFCPPKIILYINPFQDQISGAPDTFRWFSFHNFDTFDPKFHASCDFACTLLLASHGTPFIGQARSFLVFSYPCLGISRPLAHSSKRPLFLVFLNEHAHPKDPEWPPGRLNILYEINNHGNTATPSITHILSAGRRIYKVAQNEHGHIEIQDGRHTEVVNTTAKLKFKMAAVYNILHIRNEFINPKNVCFNIKIMYLWAMRGKILTKQKLGTIMFFTYTVAMASYYHNYRYLHAMQLYI